MTKSTTAELELAYRISNCPIVEKAFCNPSHECHKVVKWQADEWNYKGNQIEGSPLHRPEAWTGQLSTAPIIFIASNPSFDMKEHFANWNKAEWQDSQIKDFGANRFISDQNRKYGAIDSNDKLKRDRVIGKDGTLGSLVKHWDWVRRISALVLNKSISEVSAITDYVMTEVVHCKSPKEQGVWQQSIKTCSDRYLKDILELSPAKLIFFAGVKAGKAFAEANPNLVPDDWGSWGSSNKGKGQWPKTAKNFPKFITDGNWTLEKQMKNSFTTNFAGAERTLIYIARPGGGAGLNAPWKHSQLFHPELLNYWRSKL